MFYYKDWSGITDLKLMAVEPDWRGYNLASRCSVTGTLQCEFFITEQALFYNELPSTNSIFSSPNQVLRTIHKGNFWASTNLNIYDDYIVERAQMQSSTDYLDLVKTWNSGILPTVYRSKSYFPSSTFLVSIRLEVATKSIQVI